MDSLKQSLFITVHRRLAQYRGWAVASGSDRQHPLGCLTKNTRPYGSYYIRFNAPSECDPEVDTNGALSWAPFMEAALKEAGIEVPRPKPQSPRPPETKIEQTVADYLRKHKISFSKEQDHAGEPPEREYVPLVKEVPRYVWLLQRWLLVRKVTKS